MTNHKNRIIVKSTKESNPFPYHCIHTLQLTSQLHVIIRSVLFSFFSFWKKFQEITKVHLERNARKQMVVMDFLASAQKEVVDRNAFLSGPKLYQKVHPSTKRREKCHMFVQKVISSTFFATHEVTAIL